MLISLDDLGSIALIILRLDFIPLVVIGLRLQSSPIPRWALPLPLNPAANMVITPQKLMENDGKQSQKHQQC